MTNPKFWATNLVEPEVERKSMILRRVLMVRKFEDHEREKRENLFQLGCLINGNTSSFIIDSGSYTNAIA